MATIPDSHRDLLDAPVATLATVGADGRPQLSAVWFLADDDGVRLSLNNSRQKTKNLNNNSAATLVGSSAKARRVLGWAPQFEGLETIIETAWKWHRDHAR